MMVSLETIREILKGYTSPRGGSALFRLLGYRVQDPPLPHDLELPQQAQAKVQTAHQLARLDDAHGEFRIFHVTLNTPQLRRTEIRPLLEAFYRRHPQGNYLFIFSHPAQPNQLLFVCPRRITVHDNASKVKLVLRTLLVNPQEPFRTDLEILSQIAISGSPSTDEV